jgi:hypothetical protein
MGWTGIHWSNIVGRRFGELVAVKHLGSRVFGRRKCRMSIWQLTCDRGHIDERSLESLRVTGSKTKCKECRLEKRSPVYARNVAAERNR